MANNTQVLDANARDYLRTYIDGKMQRYYLLFAVNGGAFAIAELMRDEHGVVHPLGDLNLQRLAVGAVIFTWLLWWDIWLWGDMMRHGRPEPPADVPGVFTRVGKAILTLLSILLTVGWFLAARDVAVLTSVLVVVAPFGAERLYKWRANRITRGLTSGST